MARHKCQDCGKTFDLKRYLTKHELRMHKNVVKSKNDRSASDPLKCSMCDKVFPRLSHLQRHQMTHLNVRNYSCTFCEEKFVQKSHLTRHVSRKHSNAPGVEVDWTACDKCGQLFKTTYEMRIHRQTYHELHKCKQCQEVIEAGSDGLRKHHMQCRKYSNVCDECGASFSRPADLVSHETSCLKKFAFVCKPCDSYFRQRVQLDRHIKKAHFHPTKCSKCEQISDTPVQNSRHSLECVKVIICGYCSLKNPDKNHVATVHWHRLKRAVSKSVTIRHKLKDAPIADKDVPSSSGQSSLEEEILDDSEDDLEDTGEGLSNREQFKNRDIKRENNLEEVKSSTDNRDEEDSLFNFPDTSTSQLDFCSTAFTEDDSFPGDYVTLSICPKNTDLSFDLRDRLPPELSELFPELEATSIVLLNKSIRCRMTVRVPVCIPKSSTQEAEMRKWLDMTVVLKDD
ncbi:C2H2-type domain-containing protein [Caenorhabditis elegans]|uniref:C2H2-type domain-containing protein n=1 Tax=Caenorhabditis elegans TaxID=6239 RepID=Q9XWL0_CAEEL|nr:C2H2-type domain-containing protein [Caenorhabditis elegans]CAA21647.1 C2H2-type domain-containing protein [Caenorhabditis elegans]|eukprot:NP_502063.1 Uncharacterized protein CELE_Y5F2A.4 [Caenorhabditis elegans]